MDNPGKLATSRKDEEENTTQYVFFTTVLQTNTNNVNKTCNEDDM